MHKAKILHLFLLSCLTFYMTLYCNSKRLCIFLVHAKVELTVSKFINEKQLV